ncbi:hypothetical protein HK104_003808 [Borealophlyctis nickersoniae]|nr:hypothetical protein HK104_003808 [Borealophlyctis nickersoniae]
MPKIKLQIATALLRQQRHAGTVATTTSSIKSDPDKQLAHDIEKYINVLNGFVSGLHSDCERARVSQEYRRDPALADKLLACMPDEVKRWIQSGKVVDQHGVWDLPTVPTRDGRGGVYMMVLERHDGSFGIYTGMCGYLNNDGSACTRNTGFWFRLQGHKKEMNKKEVTSPFYAAMKEAKRYRMIPVVILNGKRKAEIEFTETLFQVALGTLSHGRAFQKFIEKERLMRDGNVTPLNSSPSLSTWGTINLPGPNAGKRVWSEEHREQSRIRMKRIATEYGVESGRGKSLGTMGDLMIGVQKAVTFDKIGKPKVSLNIAYNRVDLPVPSTWNPTPTNVIVQLHFGDAGQRRRGVWPGCPVQLSMRHGEDTQFIQKKKSKGLEQTVEWLLNAYENDVKLSL